MTDYGHELESLTDRPETDRGRALFQELLWVHEAIRRDLEIVEGLAGDVEEGMSTEAIENALRELKTTGPLWRLKVNCLHYCRFVHSHHRAEDALLFPALRTVDPSMEAIVDRLEEDHARVSDLLDAIEDAAQPLTGTDPQNARRRTIAGLRELHSHLLEHLDYEERSAGPAMRRMEGLSSRSPR